MDSKVQHLLDISSFLDPKFKTEHIAEENQSAFKKAVIQERLDVYHLAVEANEPEPAQSLYTSVAMGSSDPCDEQPPPKRSKLERILRSSNESEQ